LKEKKKRLGGSLANFRKRGSVSKKILAAS
jgi:hypothetical protein